MSAALPFLKSPKAIAYWLFACCAFVTLMVIVGAITRLSESGLSMVEWRPLMGALPPLNKEAWLRVFALYKLSPQYEQVHYWMELADFKRIFFWEWFHRALGRTMGLLYALPLLFFWIRGAIPKGYHFKLLALLFLGAAQGFMGWYMVKSGLVDLPSVSHYRLAAHLSLAFLIIALMLWMGLSLLGQKRAPSKALYNHGVIVLGSLVLTIFWGAYTAGLDAGLIYNDSFPKMGGRWIPDEIVTAQSLLVSLFETPAGVQFTHRWLAILTFLLVLSLWVHGQVKGRASLALHGLGFMALLQFCLGLATLFSHVALPLAVLHQSGALALLMLLIINLHHFHPFPFSDKKKNNDAALPPP